ncbi:hypothetical protein JCM8547_008169 [Rhodosporidiobolus lusitaniae]
MTTPNSRPIRRSFWTESFGIPASFSAASSAEPLYTSNGHLVAHPILPPPPREPNGEDEVEQAPTEVDEEERDAEALWESSLDAGEEALLRRRSRRVVRASPNPSSPELGATAGGGGGGDDVVEDTGWVYVPAPSPPPASGIAQPARYEPGTILDPRGNGGALEISPEELRASRMFDRAIGARPLDTRSEDGADDAAFERALMAAEEEERDEWEEQEERRGGGPGIWRNDPLSVPRTSALPRGGRSYRNSTFSPSNPLPPFLRHLNPPLAHDEAEDDDDDSNGWEVFESLLAPSSSTAAVNATRSPAPPPPGASSLFTTRSTASPSGVTRNAFNVLPAPRSSLSTLPPPPASPPRRRTREETNALMGHALRAKKGVYLLYCGGGEGEGEDGEGVPRGFERVEGKGKGKAIEEGGGGCGALVCARALLDGVPPKIFTDGGAEVPAASSDLPPAIGRVGDWSEDGVEEGSERVGKRGSKGCKGCVTRDVGCRRCGNHLGYRLLRPCVSCSISRPAYTSYANAVQPSSSSASPSNIPFLLSGPSSSVESSSSASAQQATTRSFIPSRSRLAPPSSSSSSASNPNPNPNNASLTLSAGGVTGGGVVDGLLFHFDLERVSAVRRLVGVKPEEEVGDARREAGRWEREEEERREKGKREEERNRQGGEGVGRRERLVEKELKRGEGMVWKWVPSPQADFLSSLLGEPSDWITPSGETWWLENAVAKHSARYGKTGAARSGGVGENARKRDVRGAFVGGEDAIDTDTLSSASTTVLPSTNASSLHRSNAIRHRSPAPPLPPPLSSLSSSSTSSSLADPATANYDRYRVDAASFSRRVRQRLSGSQSLGGGDGGEDEAAGAGGGGVLRGLERAGYGSGFGEAPEVEEARERRERERGLRRRRISGGGGRERRRDAVGR